MTGATGFLGIALCQELLQNGHEVFAVIRPNTKKRQKLEHLMEKNKDYLAKLHIIEATLDKLYLLSEEYHIQADVFFHLAWNGASGAEREDFALQYSNIQYMANAIQTAKSCGCVKIIGAGSQAEYGVVKAVAKEDETVPNPFMMYGAAKLAAYYMGKVLATQVGISLIWPRIYSIYGVGENKGTLVDYVIDTLNKGEIPQLSLCKNMWNFMEITDCVRALRILAESQNAEGIYHVASKDTRILKDFVTEIRDIVAPEGTLHFGAKESNEQRAFWLEPDTRKLEELGFQCGMTFADGIKKINYDYFKLEKGINSV